MVPPRREAAAGTGGRRREPRQRPSKERGSGGDPWGGTFGGDPQKPVLTPPATGTFRELKPLKLDRQETAAADGKTFSGMLEEAFLGRIQLEETDLDPARP